MTDGAPAKTGSKQAETQFKPGQSGNPAGRPKGARHKLGTAFLEAMLSDFEEHGVDVIKDVRSDKPDQYLKVVASILPKEVDPGPEFVDALTALLLEIDGRSKGLPNG